MMLELDKRYIINPNYDMRNEKIKILIFKQDPADGDINRYNCFNPVYGVFLSLFDGARSFKEIIDLYSRIFDSKLSFLENKAIVETYIAVLDTNFGDDFFLQSQNVDLRSAKRYDPLDFIINASDIDLSDSRLSAPLSLNFDVTFECFRKCLYCYAENEFAPSMQLLPLARIREIIDEAKNIGVRHIVIAGGDPFARKDILDVLSYVIERKLTHFVSTKAFLSLKVCEALREIGLRRIQISIDSSNEAQADFLTGSKGYFKQIVKTIKNLQACDIYVRCKAIVTSYNFREIISLLNYLDSLGIRTIQVTGYGKSIYRHLDNLFISKEDEEWLSKRVEEFKTSHADIEVIYGGFGSEYLTQEGREKAWKGRAKCSTGRGALNILPNGKVSFCEQLPSTDDFIFGDLARQSILEVWNSTQLKEMMLPDKKKFANTPCSDCQEFYECNWLMGRCIRDSYNIFRTRYAPDPKCPKVTIPIKMS